MSTLTYATHVEKLGSYKRPISSGFGPTLPAKRLSLPTGNNQRTPPFPATTARPDQRVNVRVPVTRACFTRLLPGQVAFVTRHFDKNFIGPGGVAHILSLEQLNAKLALADNHIVSSGGDLFYSQTVKSIKKPKDGKKFENTKFKAFNINQVVPDTQHPIHQFALDGLVATRVEDVGGISPSGSTMSQQLCTVSVKGHAPMRISEVPAEIHLGVRESSSGSIAQSSTTYLRPARVLAKVYVVLVAVRVEKMSGILRKWRFQYEVVSSSNLDVDPLFASGHKLFRTTMSEKTRTTRDGQRLVLRVFELGSIVDTKFGPAEQPQLVVCVHVTPFEATNVQSTTVDGEVVQFSKPSDVFETFMKVSNPKQVKYDRLKVIKHMGLRRLSSGARPFSTGGLADEIKAMKNTIDALRQELDKVRRAAAANSTKVDEVAKAAAKNAKKVDEKIDRVDAVNNLGKVQREVDEVAKAAAENSKKVDEKIDRVDAANNLGKVQREVERNINRVRDQIGENNERVDEVAKAAAELKSLLEDVSKSIDVSKNSSLFIEIFNKADYDADKVDEIADLIRQIKEVNYIPFDATEGEEEEEDDLFEFAKYLVEKYEI